MINRLGAFDLSSLTVLVVDDNAHMLRLAAAMLKGLGVGQVHKERDAAQALASGNLERYDIILSHWLMDPMSGIEFVRVVRNRSSSPKPFVPLIMMCGDTTVRYVGEARDAGVTEFLSLPFSPKQLYERLVHVIHHPRPFVDAPGFFGPDRRRKKDPYYKGEERRVSQPNIIDESPQEGDALARVDS